MNPAREEMEYPRFYYEDYRKCGPLACGVLTQPYSRSGH